MGLNNDQAAFVTGVSGQTGIDPRVLVAWMQAEGAYAANGTGGHNYLNLRPYAGDPYTSVSGGGFEQFPNVNAAVQATVRRLRQPFARPILASVGQPPAAEISAIASTGWDAGHYGGPGGPNLRAAFASIFTQAALSDRYQGPATAPAVAATAKSGSASDATSSTGGIGKAASTVGGAVSGTVDTVESVGKFLGKLTDPNLWLRGLQIVAGGGLALLGLTLLVKQVGLGVPTPPLPSRAVSTADDYAEGFAAGEGYAQTGASRREEIPAGPVPVYDRKARSSDPAYDEIPF